MESNAKAKLLWVNECVMAKTKKKAKGENEKNENMLPERSYGRQKPVPKNGMYSLEGAKGEQGLCEARRVLYLRPHHGRLSFVGSPM